MAGTATRSIVQSVTVSTTPEELFRALIQPSAIRQWWEADRAIVHAVAGGIWMAAWGDDEDHPDYICGYKLAECSPPQRLVMIDPVYHSKDGGLPFEAEMITRFEISSGDNGCTLRVEQSGFPDSKQADEFYQGCQQGWRTTLNNLSHYLSEGR